jgi:signal transduction histidine kinase
MAEKPKRGSYRLSISPTYLALICGLIILLLIIGGFFEIKRTERSLGGILESQGATLLRGLEREVQNTVSVIEVMEEVPGAHLLNIASSVDFFALEDAVIDYLIGIASMVDREGIAHPFSPSELKSLAQEKGLKAIQILNEGSQSRVPRKDLPLYEPLLTGGREMVLLPFKKPKPDKEDIFSVAIRRTGGEGIIVISVDYPRMKKLRRTFAIQNVLETVGFGEEIQYVSIFDRSLSLIAQTGKEDVGDIRDLVSLQYVQGEGNPTSGFRSLSNGQEVLEVVKTLYLGGEPYGVMQVGLSTRGIRAILSSSRRNIILSIGVLLVLGIAGVTLIYIDQNRHLRKVREMEGRVQTAERLLSIGKLGAGVALEIRNPLNAIAMAIQRLGNEFQPRDKGREREYHEIVRVIRNEIQRLNHIVEQFVLFSKPYRLGTAPSSPMEILENVSVLFAEEARTKSIEIRKEIDSRLPPLMIDKGRITQALINIVTNSIHAMEEGGNLTIKAKLDGRDWVRITVSDTGRGIPEKEIERTFDYSYTTKEKGLGLGLPIAHKIIEEHGGRITIESRVGKGTDVSIFLPVKGPPGGADYERAEG